VGAVERERGPSATPPKLLEVLELTPHAAYARCEGFLARAMKQKGSAGGGRLIHDPKLIMLDEPLTGLDAAIARQVKDLLAAPRGRAGATIILTTHILEVARAPGGQDRQSSTTAG